MANNAAMISQMGKAIKIFQNTNWLLLRQTKINQIIKIELSNLGHLHGKVHVRAHRRGANLS